MLLALQAVVALNREILVDLDRFSEGFGFRLRLYLRGGFWDPFARSGHDFRFNDRFLRFSLGAHLGFFTRRRDQTRFVGIGPPHVVGGGSPLDPGFLGYGPIGLQSQTGPFDLHRLPLDMLDLKRRKGMFLFPSLFIRK